MSQALIVKDLPALPALSAEPSGVIRALVNTTGVLDAQNDRVLPGAWRRVLSSKPRLLISHNWDELPVGKILQLEEWHPGDPQLPQWHQQNNAGGLVMTAQANMKTQAGRELYDSVAGGFVLEYSVGFMPAEKGVGYRGNERQISDVETLIEVSAVLMGASPATATLSVKDRWAGYPFQPPHRQRRPAWLEAAAATLNVPALLRAPAAEQRAAPVSAAVLSTLPASCRARFAQLVAEAR